MMFPAHPLAVTPPRPQVGEVRCRSIAITDPEPRFGFSTRHWVLAGAALALVLLGLCA